MVFKLLKSVKKQRDSAVFVYSMLCTQSFTQKTSLYLYFWMDFNNSHTILTRIVTISIFYSNSKSEKCRSNGVIFKVRTQTLASVWSIFVGFQRFARHFDENCQNKNRTIVARKATILVWVIEVYTVTFPVGRGKLLLQRLSTGGPRSDRI